MQSHSYEAAFVDDGGGETGHESIIEKLGNAVDAYNLPAKPAK